MSRLSDYDAMQEAEYVHTVVSDSRIIACGGLVAVWPNNTTRAIAWGLLSQNIAHLFPFIHKNVLRVIEESPFDRIEAFTSPNFPPAERWIRMLGFTIETPCKPFYFPDKSTAQEWVRIR